MVLRRPEVVFGFGTRSPHCQKGKDLSESITHPRTDLTQIKSVSSLFHWGFAKHSIFIFRHFWKTPGHGRTWKLIVWWCFLNFQITLHPFWSCGQPFAQDARSSWHDHVAPCLHSPAPALGEAANDSSKEEDPEIWRDLPCSLQPLFSRRCVFLFHPIFTQKREKT